MDKRTLNHYLARLAQGECSLLEVVCHALTAHLVYVPILEAAENHPPSKTEHATIAREAVFVRVRGCVRDDLFQLPIFTSRNFFEQWCEIAAHNKHRVIALLAGDLCITLPRGSSLLVDPGSDHCLSLDSEAIQVIGDVSSTRAEPAIRTRLPQRTPRARLFETTRTKAAAIYARRRRTAPLEPPPLDEDPEPLESGGESPPGRPHELLSAVGSRERKHCPPVDPPPESTAPPVSPRTFVPLRRFSKAVANLFDSRRPRSLRITR